MKRIVAAPTAGSCGVVPAVFLSLQEEKGYSEEKMVEALFVAAGIGGVIAERAFLAGAAGGCQAEIGSASAMARRSCAFIRRQCKEIANAAAMAFKKSVGTCLYPVAGLVEVPCVKRNVMGAVNALTSADLTSAGIFSKIPPDEVIDAMRSIGRSMSEDIRETGKGGPCREHRPEWRSVSGWPGAERRKHDAVDGKNEINRFWLFDKATHMTDLFDRWVVMVLLFLRYRNFLNL